MSERHYSKHANMQAALKLLRFYNQYVIFSVSDDVFNDQLLEEYFESPMNSPIEATVEKMISAAAVRTVYDHPNIPQGRKAIVAKKNAREMRDALKLAKIEYLAKVKGTLNARVYPRLKMAIPLADKVARVKQLKRIGSYATIRELAEAIGGAYVGTAIMVGRFAWSLLPARVRKSLVEKGQEIKEEALATMENCCEYIRSTRVGQAVERAVKKVAPIVHRAVTVIEKQTQKMKDKIKSWLPGLF